MEFLFSIYNEKIYINNIFIIKFKIKNLKNIIYLNFKNKFFY
jgi:hypothetical protein